MSTHIQNLTRSKVGSWQSTLPLAVVAVTWLISASPATAASRAVKSITTGTQTQGTAGTVTGNGKTVQFEGKILPLIGFTDANNQTWQIGTGATNQSRLSLQRSGNTTYGVNNRQIVWARQNPTPSGQDGSTSKPYKVYGTQVNNTQAILNQNNVYMGTDNVFTNQGNGAAGNNSDVERVDVIFGQQASSNPDQAVAIFERGNRTDHDAFKIALITAEDKTNSQHTYGGNILSFAKGWGDTAINPPGSQKHIVLNNSTGSLAYSDGPDNINQPIGGVVIPLADFGLAQGTSIAGYSLFAPDLATTSVSQLSNWQDARYFRTGTDDNSGGLDLVATDLGVVRAVVPFGLSPSLGLLLLGAIWGVPSLWQRYCNKPLQN